MTKIAIAEFDILYQMLHNGELTITELEEQLLARGASWVDLYDAVAHTLNFPEGDGHDIDIINTAAFPTFSGRNDFGINSMRAYRKATLIQLGEIIKPGAKKNLEKISMPRHATLATRIWILAELLLRAAKELANKVIYALDRGLGEKCLNKKISPHLDYFVLLNDQLLKLKLFFSSKGYRGNGKWREGDSKRDTAFNACLESAENLLRACKELNQLGDELPRFKETKNNIIRFLNRLLLPTYTAVKNAYYVKQLTLYGNILNKYITLFSQSAEVLSYVLIDLGNKVDEDKLVRISTLLSILFNRLICKVTNFNNQYCDDSKNIFSAADKLFLDEEFYTTIKLGIACIQEIQSSNTLINPDIRPQRSSGKFSVKFIEPLRARNLFSFL